jgi:hypothetical protein
MGGLLVITARPPTISAGFRDPRLVGCSLRLVAEDPGSPTYGAIHALVDGSDLRARLLRHAYARCRSVSDTKDFFHVEPTGGGDAVIQERTP